MKMLLCVLVLIIFTIFGYILAIKYRERKNFYKDFSFFNISLTNEISFGQNTIINIVKNLESNSNFNDKLKEFFLSNTNSQLDVSFLDNDENAFFKLYLDNIGKADKESQLLYLNQIDVYLNEKVQKSQLDYDKYYLTSIKMGFLIGLIAFVFLI